MSQTIDLQDDFFHSLLSDFLDESSQLMDRLNENLLQLDGWVRDQSAEEKGTIDHDLLNEMFRSAHSIKGLSAMLGLPKINGLTHNIENVFDAARRGDLEIDDGVVEVIFGSIDRLGELIDHLRHNSSDDLDCDPQIDRIRGLLQTIGADKAQGAQNAVEDMFPVPTSAVPLPPETDVDLASSSSPKELTEDQRIAIQEQYDSEFQSAIDDENVPLKYLAIFLDETELAVDEIIDLLLGSDTCDDPAVTKSLLITSHRIKGSAASVGLNQPARLAHLMEDVLQSHRDDNRALSGDLTEALLSCADGLRTYLQGLKTSQAESSEFPRLAAELMIAEQECLLNPINISESTDVEPEPTEMHQVLSHAEAETKVRAAANLRTSAGNPVYVILVDLDPNVPLIGLKAQLLYEKLGRLGEVFFSYPTASVPVEGPISQVVFGIETDRSAVQIDTYLQVAGVLETFIQPLEGVVDHCETTKVESTSNQPVLTESAATTPSEPKSLSPVPADVPPVAPAAKSSAPRSRPPEAITKPAETLRVDIERLDQLMNLAGQLVINKARFVQLGEGLRGALPHKQCGHWLATTEMQCAKLLEAVEPERSVGGHRRVATLAKSVGEVRVEPERSVGGHCRPSDLEQAKSLTRQMQNGLSAIRREFARLQEVRASLSDFFEAIHQLDRVADGIQ
ncbi:MAG: Hpt domain-containing protein, partial [Pirellulaceae bacterium]